ncbi:MAG: ABC transporter ATP-binding protein [Gemmatimonadota bacterium]
MTTAGTRPARGSAGPPAAAPVVRVEQLRKTYGGTVAVDGVSFTVGEGEIFGIIGPNGAGKTTTVECLAGLRIPDAGDIEVLGLSPRADRAALRECVGVQLQESSLPALLRVGELVDLFASFYRQPADCGELLEALGLADKRGVAFRKLSGGLKQRLSIALALVGSPRLAILDELTTGLDPQARRDTWQLIGHIRDRGVTVILVTHYMDEAEWLCDRVMLIDSGRAAAIGTPAGLAGREGGGAHLRFVPSGPVADEVLAALPEVASVEHQGHRVVVTGHGELTEAVLAALGAAGVTAHDVQLESASLEDAYVRLVGHDGAHPEGAARR